MRSVVYLVQDLFFVCKIRDVAEQLGVETQRAADAESLAAAAPDAGLVILDLRRPDALRALDLLAADPRAAAAPSVGFVDHENVELMEAATARGCGRVLSKRKFASELPALLRP
jgi:DNA-binding NarL/FixJ family response regulator